MQEKVNSKEVESKWLRGVPSNKRASIHNNFKSEHIILEKKVREGKGQ